MGSRGVTALSERRSGGLEGFGAPSSSNAYPCEVATSVDQVIVEIKDATGRRRAFRPRLREANRPASVPGWFRCQPRFRLDGPLRPSWWL